MQDASGNVEDLLRPGAASLYLFEVVVPLFVGQTMDQLPTSTVLESWYAQYSPKPCVQYYFGLKTVGEG